MSKETLNSSSNLATLFEYCEKNDVENLKRYIPSLENINQQDAGRGWSLLSVAAYNHSKECVEYLLSNGADINIVNFKGTTVLMYAKSKVIENKNFDFLDYLIMKGANLVVKDNFDKNIFDYVLETNDNDLIQYFKKYF